MTLLLHDLTTRQLAAAVAAPAGSYVFHGPRGIGKATAARDLARQLNCQGDTAGLCKPCRQFVAGSYPDLLVLQPEGRASITIEQVRTLGHTLTLSPYYAEGARIVIIDEAQALTIEAQNALLKLIEEPPARTHFVLVAEQLESLLPTVCSRVAPVYFAPVTMAAVADLLVGYHDVEAAEARRLAELAAGAPGLAIQLANDEAAADSLAELDEAASSALAATVFDRLLLARRLVDNKADLMTLAGRLQRRITLGLVAGAELPQRAAHRLAALEHFRRGLVANVGPRVALERLMLEL